MVLTERIEADKILSAISMLKVIAHPVRLAIVDLLTENNKLTVLEIQEALNLEQAITSQHLTLMEDKGVLVSEKVSRNKYVSLRYPKMKTIVNCLETAVTNSKFFMLKYIYIAILLFWFNAFASAQDVPHLNAWSRISISQPITEKWRVETELQHRRQNDYVQQTKNLFDENLLSSIRTWVHYQHKDDLSFSFSPFAYYWHNSIILKDIDKEKPQIKEIRFSVAADLKHEVIKKIWLINRTCFEYRDFQNTNTDFTRIRNRLGLRYEFTDKWNLTFYDEVFLNLKGANPVNFFDHDRLAFLLNYKPNKHLRLETGYIYILRLPKGSDEFLRENNFLIHIYYTLPHKEHRNHSKT